MEKELNNNYAEKFATSLNRQAIYKFFPNSNPISVSKNLHSAKAREIFLTRGFELRLVAMLVSIEKKTLKR